MFGPPPPQTQLARIRGKLSFLPAWLHLIVRARRGRPTELWIGDSHAMTFNRAIDNSMFMTGPEGQLILRLGPRLMWSLAKNGFPVRVQRVTRFLGRWGRRGSIVPMFCSGEIDVRAHLVPKRGDGYAFVDEYVDRCMRIAEEMHAGVVCFVVPPPPFDLMPEEAWYPTVGTIGERLAVFDELRAALRAAASRYPSARVLDFTSILTDESGGLRRDLTVDGCHVNLEAVALVRSAVRAMDLSVAT